MSVVYSAIQWNAHKRRYDALALCGVAVFVGGFVLIGKLAWRGPHALSDEVLVLRALGSCAFTLLTIVLCIGPLARLDRRFLPLLYNRRHLGVLTFLVALAHAALTLGYYHGFGVVNPLVSLLTNSGGFEYLQTVPFEFFGLAALGILFLMAATSHDFWLRNLSPRCWKTLHMLVYPAYILLVAHVAFGAVQSARGPLASIGLCTSVALVAGLHIVSGWRERTRDRARGTADPAWIDAGPAETIAEGSVRVVGSQADRIAVCRHNGKLSALRSVCAHQGGPVGEGKIIDGCLTCPWHGWQYRPEDGRSPPPFREKLDTYPLRVVDGRVQIGITPDCPDSRTHQPGAPHHGTV